MDVKYTLDGVDIKTYGVYISKSFGFHSKPDFKKITTHDWAEYNGEVVDLAHRYVMPREITLECFIRSSTQADFTTKCNTFLNLFDKKGLLNLSVVIDENKPFPYLVYLDKGVDVKKDWQDGPMVGVFTLKLREPEPVKRVIKFVGTLANRKATLTLTSSKLLNIYWGDNLFLFDVSGSSTVLTHTYAENGTYFIVITGNIDEITALTHNGTEIWTKL